MISNKSGGIFRSGVCAGPIFARNMSGWNSLYSLPTEAFAKLDIPMLNFGPLGKDAHKNTERLHLPYFLEVFPELLHFVVRRIAEHL